MSNPTIGSQDPLARITANTAAGSNEAIFEQSTAIVTNAATSNAVTITTSVNNDTGDVVRVYSTPGAISVSAVDQVINQYTAVSSGVSNIIAGNNISITSTGGNGQGSVTINADIGNVGNVAIANNVRLNAQPNITSVGTLTSLSVSGTILGNNVQVSNGVFSGNGSGLTNLVAANITGAISLANNVSNASQPNITSLGDLLSLKVGNGDAANSIVFSVNPNGAYSNSLTTSGITYFDAGASNSLRSLNYIKAGNTVVSPEPVSNITTVGRQNYRVFNGNTLPAVGQLNFISQQAANPNFTGNLAWTPGQFTVFTGNPTGNLTAVGNVGKNDLSFNQYGQLLITNGDGAEETAGLAVNGITNTATSSPILYLSKFRGTGGNSQPIQANDRLGSLFFTGYNGSNSTMGARLIATSTSNAVIANGAVINTDLSIETIQGNIYLEPLFANFAVNPNGKVIIGDQSTLATLVANTVNSNVVLANTITSNGLTLQGITNANTAQALFYNTSTGAVTYDNVGSLQGLQGITGSTGIQGITGSIGIQGLTGTGIQGAAGSTGIQGITGSIGIQGIAGSTGIQGVAGSTGIQGITGSTGLLNGMPYSFNTQTSNTDPSFGKLSFDTATLASITEMYISSSDNQSNLVTSWITSFDDFGGSSVKGTLLIRSNTRSYVFLYLNITGNVVFNGLYYTVPVDVVTSTSIFTSNESLSILFTPAGLTGIQGITGSIGIQGITGSTGIQGIQGIQSVQGLQGLQGTTGPSATNILTTTTNTNLTDLADAINTTGKATGLMVFNTTNNLIYVASGSSASSAWYPSDGSSAINPV